MTARFPMMLTLAALIGFASPALAAESHGAKVDPQAAATTSKSHTHQAKGRTAQTEKTEKKSKKSAKKSAQKGGEAKAPASASQPASK